MTVMETLQERGAVAFAFAAALEQSIGGNVLLTVGMSRTSVDDVLHDDQARVVELPFVAGDGAEGLVAFVALPHFAEQVESAAPDEILLTGCADSLAKAVAEYGAVGGVDVDAGTARESDLAAISAGFGSGEVVVYPLLEGTDPVACLVVAPGSADPGAAPVGAGPGAVAPADATAAPLVLAEVEMGVTAELGRCHITVRDLLALTPGTVIDLDRAAGAPVDVLVNGTLIARGEVVVVDEEFGIRISEILNQENRPY